ncbi:MAG: hypothetical protein K5780_01150 [Alphaproteobacteria bacterium]|nr:hypothetical protein [Alphaproteobacteria bacterium]
MKIDKNHIDKIIGLVYHLRIVCDLEFIMFSFSRKKKEITKNNFTLQGNRIHLRTEREMLSIDKKAADKAFRKYNQAILWKKLQSYGFKKWKTNSFVRLNPINLLEFINTQKEAY